MTLNRGDADSPMLMLNHWADVFPPRRERQRRVPDERGARSSGRTSARASGACPVNLIAVDHYDQGELIEAVEKLNRERVRAQRQKGS